MSMIGNLRRLSDAVRPTGHDGGRHLIYPAIWDRPSTEDDTRGYLLEYFAQLREFIVGAAATGEALLGR